ncbi:MAG: class I SAM-dependent methyltransferase [Candidatus Marinimicrobia bacterium]|nr:class I SAM-dependent methyltransferase [Candidatus Neomarinimicrobiota bacterium]
MTKLSKIDKSGWDDYWKSRSLKRKFIEFIRKIYFSKIFIRDVLKYSEPGDGIIEAGCGSGTYLKLFEGSGRIAFGLDYSPESVKLSKINCDNIIRADMGEMPTKDRSFKVIFSQGVMEHFTDEQFNRFLKEQKRVSKHVIIILPCKWSIWRIYDPIGDDPNKRFFSKKKLTQLMKTEFDDVKVRYMWESGLLSMIAIGSS